MDEVATTDLILKRYGSSNEINNMPFDKACQLIQYAYQKEDEDRWYELYCHLQPTNDEHRLKSFESWYKELRESAETLAITQTMSKEDILKKAESIRERSEQKHGDI